MRTNRKEVFFRKAFSLFLVLFAVLTVQAEVKLPRLISDGMVLQRDTDVKVWGRASANEKVEVKFDGKLYSTVAAQDGRWEITLPPQPAGGPYDMSVNNITIKDVLFGDVWLCSGQSNMELPIRRVLDLYADEVKSVNNPYIRQFNVAIKYDFTQACEDVEGGSWKAVTPENILDFSAVAYFFAKDLYGKYGVPVGLIKSAAGGSPVEAWISEDNLKHFPPYLAVAKECAADGYIEGIRNAENKASHEWYSELTAKDKGISNWNKANFDDSDWGTVYLPGYWEDQGVTKSKGSFWLRKDFEVTETMAGKPAVLRLGCIVDADSAFVNGHFVGNITYQYPPRIYNIPEGILKKGKNNITVRVVNSGGKGGFVEDKPYRIIADDEYADLTGEWKYKVGAEMRPGPSQTFFQYKPMGLYNGMIAPLKNYAVKGVIWYQGESNVDRLDDYRSLFPALISDWREKWDMPDMPFLYVQLPNFMKTREQPSDGGWARFREVQAQNLTIPNTAMAVTIGLGEWNDIHPLNKKGVGHRLALAAMKTAYGDAKVVSTGPIYKDISVRGNKIVVSFDVEGKGIATGEELKGFAVAGEDRRFVWATARIEGDKVIVWNDNIANPVAVRYAWADNPAGANLKNKEGLPASPFRTDTW